MKKKVNIEFDSRIKIAKRDVDKVHSLIDWIRTAGSTTEASMLLKEIPNFLSNDGLRFTNFNKYLIINEAKKMKQKFNL